MAAALAAEWWWLPPEGYPQRYGYTGDQYQPIGSLFIQLVIRGWIWFRSWFDRDTITTLAIVATAIFTGTLWRATDRLMRAARRQSQDTRIAFISANRPKVVLRRILYIPITMDGPLDIHFRLTNIGASGAVIRRRHFHFELRSGKGIPTHDHRTESEPIRLAAGESVELYYASHTDDWESVFTDRESNGTPIDVYWVGQILYEDGAGIQRSAGFCRRFDRERHRWVRTDDPDEEYSD
jgi:hypothetical protein